jgi:Carboxypeptidase regulatory-like domain/Photosynthesis system II assembly factor YCF48
MKDDSAREKAIEKLVAEKLRSDAAAPSAPCPDAGILAAYYERSLAPGERATWEAHFDKCARCQARIAALARMSSGDEESPLSSSAAPRRQARKFFGMRWAWAAPLFVALVVAGLWYTGEFEPFRNQTPEAPRQVASPSAIQPAPSATATEQEEAKSSRVRDEDKKGSASAPSPAPRIAEKKEGAAPASPSPQDKLQLSARAMEPSASNEPSPAAGRRESPALTQGASGGTNRVQMSSLPPPPKATGQGGGAAGEIASPAERMQMAAPERARESSAKSLDGIAGGVASTPAPQRAVQPLAETIRSQPQAPSMQLESARLIPAAKASANGPLGVVSGIVKDASGAAVPGATITVRNTGTNITTVLTADNAGAYLAAGLDPGIYAIQAGAPGFRPSAMNEVTLQAHADRKVDFALQVGSVAQTVTVEAQAAAVQTAATPWRVGPHGLIQKQAEGNEWESKVSGVTEDLFDIAFPTARIGWVVGQGGTVLRSIDGGETWARLASPTNEDLLHVTATSAKAAKVTTSSGRVFSTRDGGETWKQISGPK